MEEGWRRGVVVRHAAVRAARCKISTSGVSPCPFFSAGETPTSKQSCWQEFPQPGSGCGVPAACGVAAQGVTWPAALGWGGGQDRIRSPGGADSRAGTISSALGTCALAPTQPPAPQSAQQPALVSSGSTRCPSKPIDSSHRRPLCLATCWFDGQEGLLGESTGQHDDSSAGRLPGLSLSIASPWRHQPARRARPHNPSPEFPGKSKFPSCCNTQITGLEEHHPRLGAGFKLPLPSSGPPSGNVAAAREAAWRDGYWLPALSATACLETPVCVGLLRTKITGPCALQKLAAWRQTRSLPRPGSLHGVPAWTPSPRCQEQLTELPQGSLMARVFLLLLGGTQKLVPVDCNFTHGWFSYASGYSLRFPITFSSSLFIPSTELRTVGIPGGSKLLSWLLPCHPVLQSHHLHFKALFLHVPQAMAP